MSDRSRERDRPDLGVAPNSEPDGLCARAALLLGRYELGLCRRSGGVCEAFDRQRRCDVLIHHAPIAASACESREALLAGLRPLIEFRHPNVVPLLDLGIENDELVFVCDRADGDLLSELLPASGPLDAETASDLAAQICDALSAAHRQGLRHGGLSPERILITDSGDPLLLHFGWSDLIDDSAEASEFTPPEQRASRRAGDQRSDLWGLGAILCKATTGASPAVAHPECIPEPLRASVLKALCDDPQRRPQSADEFRAALRPSTAPEFEATVATTAWSEPARRSIAEVAAPAAAARSNPFFPLVIAAGAVFVVTILAMLAAPFGDPEAPVAGWLDRYAGRLILVEVALILVLGFLALLVDRRRTVRRLAAGGIGSPAALDSARDGPARPVGQSKPVAARPE